MYPHMIADIPTLPSRAWTPRIAFQLAVLASAAFVYVTAEMVPVGALPDIASDLRVSEAVVGTLLASYALVAAVTTVPLVRLTAHWPRRRTLMLTLVCLTASQLISALAPNFAVLAGGRVLCALTHGLMWSVIAPIGARLVPATHTGRATTAVYVGTTLALVVGNPLTAAMSVLWGWRLAVVVVTVAAAAVTARRVGDAAADGAVGRRSRHRAFPRAAPPQQPAGGAECSDAHRGHRPFHLLHVHRGDHPRRRRCARPVAGLVARRVRSLRPAVDGGDGPTA